MADAKFEEVLRLAFEVGGLDGIKAAVQAFVQLGDVSLETKTEAAALLDTIAASTKAEKTVDTFRQAAQAVVDYQAKISTAKEQVQALAAAFAASESPTKGLTSELARARENLRDLSLEQQSQLVKLREARSALDAAGVSTKTYSGAQRDLTARTDQATASIRDLISGVQAQRAAQAKVDAGLINQNLRWKEVARAVEDAASAERKAAAASVEASRTASEGLDTTREAAGRLRDVLAGLAAFFSFDALKEGVKSILETGNEFAKFEKQLNNLYGTQAKGQAAFDWVKTFTKETPLQLQDVMKSFITLKNFGIDPMNGSLQAIVDQNAKLGGESERLERITLALGQAWAKGKLQGEEIMQLVEASVPVYQILGEVTGKSAGELQNLSKAGKLGTDVLQKFIAQMGKDSLGAAADQVGLVAGQWTVLKDNLQQAEDEVAKSGLMDFLRDQLKALNDQFSRMSADGSLKAYAQRVSDALVGLGKGLKSVTLFAIDHAAAIGNIAKAYAAFKIGSMLGELALASGKFIEIAKASVKSQDALGGVASKATLLTKVLRAVPANIQIAIAVAGFELLKEAGEAIGEFAGKHSAAQKNLDALIKRQRDAVIAQARAYQQAAADYSQYQGVQVKGAAEVAAMRERERAGYESQLKGFTAYADAQYQAQVKLAQAGEASADDLNKARAAMQSAHRAADELAAGVRVANDALSRGLPVAAAAAQDKLKGLGSDTEAAKTRLAELFQGFQTATITQLGDLALGIARAGGESQVAANTIQAALGGVLSDLSNKDLLKFQSAATAAMEQFKTSGTDAANVVLPLLEAGLTRLGLAADRWGIASTDAGQQNIAAFRLVAENAAATSQQIEAAANKALANATTAADAQAIGDALQAAGRQGKLGFDATERSMAAVQNRMRQLQTALDPLADSFAQLGIQSKRSLDDAAAAATSAFAAIVTAQRKGQASIEDVRAAFLAYSKAQQDAAANSDVWKQTAVDANLKVQASVLGVYNGLQDVGQAGLDAGGKIARGAGHASAALDDAAAATHRSADANERVSQTADDATDSDIHYSEAADKAAKADREHAKATEAMSYSLSGFSDQLVKTLADLNRFAGIPRVWRQQWNDVMQQATDQLNQFKAQMADLEAANGQFDPMAKKIAGLRTQYKFLNDDQISALAQAQDTLERNQQAARDEAARKEQDANELTRQRAEEFSKGAGSDGAGTSGAVAPEPTRFALDVSVKNQQADGTAAVQIPDTEIRRIVDRLTPAITKAVVRTLSIRKAATNK